MPKIKGLPMAKNNYNSIFKELLDEYCENDLETQRVRNFTLTYDNDPLEVKGFYINNDSLDGKTTKESAGEIPYCSDDLMKFIGQLQSIGYSLDLFGGNDFRIYKDEVITSRFL